MTNNQVLELVSVKLVQSQILLHQSMWQRNVCYLQLKLILKQLIRGQILPMHMMLVVTIEALVNAWIR